MSVSTIYRTLQSHNVPVHNERPWLRKKQTQPKKRVKKSVPTRRPTLMQRIMGFFKG